MDEQQLAAMRQALKRAFQLGQNYWSWADSEYSSHWKKADAAKAEFDKLVEDTTLITPPAPAPVQELSAAMGARLTRAQLSERLGIHRNTLARRLSEPGFPQPDKDGKWLLSEVIQWERSR
jgi:predicted DNA-binding transcriptional regulator AlpA